LNNLYLPNLQVHPEKALPVFFEVDIKEPVIKAYDCPLPGLFLPPKVKPYLITSTKFYSRYHIITAF